jgi:hypothetical protein
VYRSGDEVSEAFSRVRDVLKVRGRSNSGCDAPISRLLKGLLNSGIEGARADDMHKLDMTRAFFYSNALERELLHLLVCN